MTGEDCRGLTDHERSLPWDVGVDLTGSDSFVGEGGPRTDPDRSLTGEDGLDLTDHERSLTGDDGLDLPSSGFGLDWLCSSKNLDILFMSSFRGEGGWAAVSPPVSAGFGDC